MDRKLIVNLLQKNIQELGMITEGFMEMTEYPAVIIQLARQKANDVLGYIQQLESIKKELVVELNENKDEKDLSPQNQEEISGEEPLLVAEEDEEFNNELIEESAQESVVEEEMESIEDESQTSDDELKDAETHETTIPAQDTLQEEPDDEIIEEEQKEEVTIIESSVEEVEVIVEVPVVEENDTAVLDEGDDSDTVSSVHTYEYQRAVLKERTIDNTDNTIAGAHNNRKIDDIRRAISIGDRFRFQRELFDGNGELLNKTLSKLNEMKDYEEAHAYLQAKFKWNEEDETVESFYQIVKRRFL
ncbi:hypothetical protein D0T49_12250 [Paludibacter sp. 221]|uniref:hypothetical protein n=1 Tax=Paludibacter sp. 221 TaxID=2302939 RepID=UPI0013D40884|nr:hypothetical protein [Paludibacter sp. 221]NDV47818.1 hypothetical protein [Paludibacter sp. 221]